MQDAFVAKVSRRSTGLLVFGAFVFVGLGIVMLRDPHGRDGVRDVIAWAAILFFGLCGLVGLGQLFSRGPVIRIDERGIWWKRWSDDTIPWTAMTGLYPASVGRTAFLCLTLADPAAYPSTHIMGKVARLNRAMAFGDVSVSVTGTDRAFGDLVDAVARFAPRALLEPPPPRPEL